MCFHLGDSVAWTSQANGSVREKTGEVRQVVVSGELPDRDRFPGLYKGSGVGAPRPHESYVVVVDGKGAYWPRVAALRARFTPACTERARMQWVGLCRENGLDAQERAALLEDFVHKSELLAEFVRFARQRVHFAREHVHAEPSPHPVTS
jgi:hypothetical protein